MYGTVWELNIAMKPQAFHFLSKFLTIGIKQQWLFLVERGVLLVKYSCDAQSSRAVSTVAFGKEYFFLGIKRPRFIGID